MQKIKKFNLKCLYCGHEFEVYRCRKNIAKFCSISCFKKYSWKQPKYRQNIINQLKGKHNSPKTEFKKGKHYNIKTEFKKGQHPSQKTEFKKGRLGLKGQDSPVYIDGRTNKIHYCIDCDKRIKNIYSKRCRKCSGKIVSEKIKGKKNGQYVHGKSFKPYPLGWTKTFKEQIRYRDGYKCQICGKPEVENCRKLDVHHIDYDKENIDPENLTSLCKSCHMKTNGNRDYWYVYCIYIMEEK